MAALVLGLLVSSAKGFYDAQSAEVTVMSAKIILFDRVPAHFGPVRSSAWSALTTFWHFSNKTARFPLTNILAPGAMGTSDQVAPNETTEGQAENRSVVVRILQNNIKGVSAASRGRWSGLTAVRLARRITSVGRKKTYTRKFVLGSPQSLKYQAQAMGQSTQMGDIQRHYPH
jgi:hypothetical protein